MKPTARHLHLLICLLLCLLIGGPAVRAQDPAAEGPFATQVQEYDLGDEVFKAPSLPGKIEVRARVHYPVTGDVPPQIPPGPLPLIILLHGNHPTSLATFTVTSGGVTDRYVDVPVGFWPATVRMFVLPDGTMINITAATRIDSYRGYDYLAQRLATQGFIVASLSANSINAQGNMAGASNDIRARARLIRHHLKLWQRFNNGTAPPRLRDFNKFRGKVDLGHIGLMGHSRGGEGVIQYVRFFPNGPGNPFTIRGALAIAPTDFNVLRIHNVPVGVLLSYCDGDVTPLSGVHFFDRERNRMIPPDPAARHMFLVLGGNHNFYNTEWSPLTAAVSEAAIDDWCTTYDLVPNGMGNRVYRERALSRSEDPECGCPNPVPPENIRLDEEEQQDAGLSIAAGFFRTHVNDEIAFLPILKGDRRIALHNMDPNRNRFISDRLPASYHPPSDARLLVDDFTLPPPPDLPPLPVGDRNLLGGPNDRKLLDPYLRCGFAGVFCLPAGTPVEREPHSLELPVLSHGWEDARAVYYTEMPDARRDVSGFAAFQFRVSVNFTDPRNAAGEPQDLIVTLADADGNSNDVPISRLVTALDVPNTLFYPPGQQTAYSDGDLGPVPHLVLNTRRIPLTAFPDVDLTKVKRIYFRFTDPDCGALVMTDILFAD